MRRPDRDRNRRPGLRDPGGDRPEHHVRDRRPGDGQARGATTNGSQFFIISGDDGAALPPEYSLFGKVDPADLAVVATLDALGNPDPSASGVPPKEPITIESVTIAPAS